MKQMLSFIGIIVFSLAAVSPAMAADAVGTVTFVKGRVDITRPGEEAEPLNIGDEVYVGNIVRTKTGARAEITFIDESIVRLAQQSRVDISEYMVKKDQQRSRLSLFRGKIQSLAKKIAGRTWGRKKRHRFLIQTPTAVCGVRGTDFFTWFVNGTTGVAFTDGSGELSAGGDPNLSQIVNAGQTGIVTDAFAMPTVQPTDPSVLEPLQQETIPTEEEVATAEAEIAAVQEAVRSGRYEEVTGSPAGDQQRTGPAAAIQPPISFIQDPNPVETSVSEEQKLAVATEAAIQAITLVVSNEFTLGETVYSYFLTDATINGFVVEPSVGAQQSEFVLSGKVGPNYTASTVYAMSDITGSTLPKKAITGKLATADDAQAGAFSGEVGGVAGTWRGLFFSIYARRPAPEGDIYEAGFLYGGMAGNQPTSIFDVGKDWSAAGSLILSESFGEVQIPEPAPPAGLGEALYNKFDIVESYVPGLDDLEVGPSIKESSTSRFTKRLTLTEGNVLEVWLQTISADYGRYKNEDGLTSWVADYGQTDGSYYYILGSVSGTDDNNGHVSISGNPRYLDTAYFGEILVEHRGTYFPTDDESFPYDSVTSGAIIKTPLAWGIDTLYDNSDGVMISVNNEWGIAGGRTSPLDNTTAELIAYGAYEDDLAGGHYLWNSELSGSEIDDSSAEFEGYTAGFWRNANANLGNINGQAIAIYKDLSGNAGLLGSINVAGSYYPGLKQWYAVGDWVQSQKESTLSTGYYFSNGSLTNTEFSGQFSDGGNLSGFQTAGETKYLLGSETLP